jgi:hypothetical protein
MAERQYTSRRTLLKGLTASGGVLALAHASRTHTPTPIIRLYRRWEVARAELCGASDDDCDRLADRLFELEDQMLALPSQSAADIAAKIAAYSHWGDAALPEPGSALWTEIGSLIASA